MNLQNKIPKHMRKPTTRKESMNSTIEKKFDWKKLKYWNSLGEQILDAQKKKPKDCHL